MQAASPPGRTLVMPQAGSIVAGKYAIVRVLGEGGMGIVYEATHQRLKQRVALKMLLPAMLEHEVIVSRFEREARAAAQLRGRHVARVNDVDVTADGVPYMVMDFLEGHDLQVEIERRGRLPIPEAVDYVLQACAAMVEAHQLGIVHRDLKPSNLFLERSVDGGGQPLLTSIVKVLDFGISKVLAETDSKLTEADTIMGTALYMSPEQVKASHLVDNRSDIWALGVILYEAISGRVPFLGPPHQVAARIVSEDVPDIRQHVPEVSDELASILRRALSRDLATRYPDVRQLSVALAPYAPLGSMGRAFADGVAVVGSTPRVAITPGGHMSIPPDSASLPPASDRTVMNAPGVGAEMMHVETSLRWDRHADAAPLSTGSTSRNRALLAGVLIALVISVVSIGVVAVFVRKRGPDGSKPAASAVASGESASGAGPTTTTTASTTATATPSATVAGAGASNEVPANEAPSTSARSPAPARAASAKAVTPPASPPPPAPKPVPTPAKSAAPGGDKPLFL